MTGERCEQTGRAAVGVAPTSRAALLSIDFEDWHQLVRRRVGAVGWERGGPALERQTEASLELLEELGGIRATFFILGMAARAHPRLLERIVAAGHEVGCHGDAHRPVHGQTPSEFTSDLRAARATIEALSGRTPIGYRAPAFSITRGCSWAFDVLAQEGFRYDASQHDTPRVRDRLTPAMARPHRLGSLWEFPTAVWPVRTAIAGRAVGARLPVGGAAYWSLLPGSLILRGLSEAGEMPGLYLHPHELDPQRLRPRLPPGARASQRVHASFRAAQRNLARRRAADVLRAIARRFDLISYGEGYERVVTDTSA